MAVLIAIIQSTVNATLNICIQILPKQLIFRVDRTLPQHCLLAFATADHRGIQPCQKLDFKIPSRLAKCLNFQNDSYCFA